MGENRKFYWMKLKKDFFSSKRIKKLRKIAGGDTYTIIYLKMQLKALDTEGYLYFDGYMENFYEELALDIDEEVENVKVTVTYLLSVGLIECNADGSEWKLPYLEDCIGSESASAQRVREHRKRKKEALALQCNTDVTAEKQKTLQCNTDETKCNTEKEKYLEINIDIDKDDRVVLPVDSESDDSEGRSSSSLQEVVNTWNTLSDLGIPEIRKINNNTVRAKYVRARLKEYGPDCFKKAVEEIRKSEFLQGQGRGGLWMISFDWLIKPRNFKKVIEGKYETFENPPGQQSKNSFNNFNQAKYSDSEMADLENALLEN